MDEGGEVKEIICSWCRMRSSIRTMVLGDWGWEMSDPGNSEWITLGDLARSCLNGELSTSGGEDSIPKVRSVILALVPEVQPIVDDLESEAEDSKGWVTLWDYVRSLADVLRPSLEKGDVDLIRRCLKAAEELLGHSSVHVRELVVEQIVENMAERLLRVSELCGPRVMALLERGTT